MTLWSVAFVFLILNTSVLSQNIRPNHVAINEERKHIDVDSSWLDKTGQEIQQVGLDASDKEKVLVDLINSRKQLSASAHGNIAAAETSDGHRAQVQRFGDKGGLAQIEGHKAQLKTKEDGSDKHAYLKADNEYELDTIARGSLKDAKDSEFIATNKRFDFELKPNEQTKSDGVGIVAYNDKEKGNSGRYAYTIKQDGKKTDATLSAHNIADDDDFTHSLFGRRSEKYHCSGEFLSIILNSLRF